MNKVDIQIFNHNDVNHMRCIRDVEMEIRYGNKCPVFNDEHNDVRQHIRDVLINKTVENKEITEFYNFMVNMLSNVSKEIKNYE